ncbi:MAG: aldehyde dehydrogenase family protein [Elusimicrobia bacterium]|nr:aldehyde dehydrogenase family protein [Elusimicrobiota bacterium]
MSLDIPGPHPETSPELAAQKAAAARAAFLAWSRADVAQRVAALRGVWSELARRRAEGAAVVAEEIGKPAAEIELLEFGPAALLVDHFTKSARRLLDERSVRVPWIFANKRAAVRRRPRGVIGVISPWNMPFLIPFGDAFCAMLAGNAVLLKPSEWATRTALWLEAAVAATGLLPEGLLSVVPGAAGAGERVADASDLVLFTGSASAGRAVAARAAGRLTPAILELGGKHPMIVLADAPLERASAAAVWGAFQNAGQVCVGVERAFVEGEVHDAFVEKVRARMSALRLSGPDAEIGRFVLPAALDRVQAQLDDARAKGARVIGGEVLDRPGRRMAPALVLDARPDMAVMSAETFGPVLAVMKVARAEDAVVLCNAGPFGLAASVWSRDVEKAERLAAALDAGMTGVNEPGTHYGFGSLPFGGAKESGLWRRHGDEGLLALTQAQSLLVHEWPLDVPDPWWFPYEARKTSLLARLLGLP